MERLPIPLVIRMQTYQKTCTKEEEDPRLQEWGNKVIMIIILITRAYLYASKIIISLESLIKLLNHFPEKHIYFLP